jgi:hypothetical protein
MGALTDTQIGILRKSGFIEREIMDFDNAKTPTGQIQQLNFDAENFQIMIRNRIAWIARLKDRGVPREIVGKTIEDLYTSRQGVPSAFSLLQIEASPSARQRGESDQSIARRLIALGKIQMTMGKSYASETATGIKTAARNIPHPPERNN